MGVEERSDETPRAEVGQDRSAPDPEVVAKPTRRQFTGEYRLRIVEEADRVPAHASRDERGHVRAFRQAAAALELDESAKPVSVRCDELAHEPFGIERAGIGGRVAPP